MSHANLKPIHVYGTHGPNPPKVAIVLEELGVPAEFDSLSLFDVKKPEFLAVNPNGRMPAIKDPNHESGELVLWESGAIIEYLVERYDTNGKLSFPAGSAEAQHARQWLFYQVSGQGPYYGQAVWFKKYHPERIESAVQRYTNEIKRVTGVVEGVLKKHIEQGTGGADGPWLVGGKASYADLAWVCWQAQVPLNLTKEEYNEDEFPLVKDWVERIFKREAVAKVFGPILEQTKQYMAQQSSK